MAAGTTAHVWTVGELLHYWVPPPQPGQFPAHLPPIEVRLVPIDLRQEFVQGTLVFAVQKQVFNRRDRDFITGDQSGHVFAKVLTLLIRGKYRVELRHSLLHNPGKVPDW